MQYKTIEQSVRAILSELPAHVQLVAAAKTRTTDEVKAAIQAGVRIIGYNYVQEAEQIRQALTDDVKWHMIGHLQRNKARKALNLFDMVETLDSVKLAQVIEKINAEEERITPVLIEVNSGREEAKAGVFPEDLEQLIRNISTLKYVRVMGLMTMGPFSVDPEVSRPYFRVTGEAFKRLEELKIPRVEMRYLSMGMSDSYHVAIEEGANLVRIGTKLFGPRE
jgi:pyridoxal phosphate enzyme (YggS family)